MKPVALTIAGSDPSGGAGLQADLKTFHQYGVYGMSVVTLLTVQNTRSVDAVQCLEPSLVHEQLVSVVSDIPPSAAKTGALGNARLIEQVAADSSRIGCRLVVDPVMISKHGFSLLEADAVETFRNILLGKAFLVTPNLYEATTLTGIDIRTRYHLIDAARALLDMGPRYVVIKASQLDREGGDLLLGADVKEFWPTERVDTPHTHGSGCVFSAAITAGLALGKPVPDAVSDAKRFITGAIRKAPGLGSGNGPVHLFD